MIFLTWYTLSALINVLEDAAVDGEAADLEIMAFKVVEKIIEILDKLDGEDKVLNVTFKKKKTSVLT
jgi:hypothetical protein